MGKRWVVLGILLAFGTGCGVRPGDTKDPKTSLENLNAVYASSFKNQKDIAPELQAAINDPSVDAIVFDRPAARADGQIPLDDSPVYVSSGIRLRSDLKLIFEEDVTLQAKSGAFPNTGDMFLRGDKVKNVSIEGAPGAVIRMNKREYTDGEWRMALAFYSSENITVRNITLRDSGGDGICLCNNTGVPNRNVLIDSVVADNNSRNGLSVISVDGLVVKNSVFSNTKSEGAATNGPWDGIDLEPDHGTDILKNIEISDCSFHNNGIATRGAGIDVHLPHMTDPATNAVSIRIKNIRVFGSLYGVKVIKSSLPYRGLVAVDGLRTDLCGMNRAAVASGVTPGTFSAVNVSLCQTP